MSVQQDKKTKTFFVRWIETNPTNGDRVHRSKRGFKTKREAIAFERSLEERKQFVTFGQLMEEYLQSLVGYSSDYTINQKRTKLKLYASEFMETDVKRIDKKMLVQWTNRLANLDRSVNIKNKVIQYFRAVSRYGHAIYEFTDFAAPVRYFPEKSGDVRQINIISPEEFSLIMDQVENPLYRHFFTFIYHTGLRRGEAIALLKADIEGNRCRISKSMGERKKGFGRLKNASSERIITLDRVCMDIVGDLMPERGRFLFGGISSLAPTSIERHWKKALKSAGFPQTYRIHDLRHSFISNAIGNGIDIVTVSRYVGHRDIKETLNTYSHTLKGNEEKMISALEGIY